MQKLINSSLLIDAVASQIYREKYEEKNFTLADVQLFWSDFLVSFSGDEEIKRKIAYLATKQLTTEEQDHIRKQMSVDEWSTFEAFMDTDWPMSSDVYVEEGDLETEQSVLISKLNNDAERVRLKSITPGFGMTMTYNEKKLEAEAFLADDTLTSAEVPHIFMEAEVDEVTPFEKAVEIVSIYEQWKQLSAMIEEVRMTGKRAIRESTTVAEARSAYYGLDWSVILGLVS